ncbi:hypothetical protein [Dokdonella sp.]|uniref:hypothetical protein n=1 Tax=Dokdonella sp. TaxID=2291710 RepID=UPI00352791A5
MNEHSIRCVDWTPDYLDGLVLVALLRSRDIDAQLFDENFVRQDWFRILAYGGFRIAVPALDLQSSREVLTDYRRGALQLPDEELHGPSCPACHDSSAGFDHRQRRWIFLAFLFVCTAQTISILAFDTPAPYLILQIVISLAMMMPWLVRYVVNNRMRCPQCLHAWRELPRIPFARQQKDADIALTATPA